MAGKAAKTSAAGEAPPMNTGVERNGAKSTGGAKASSFSSLIQQAVSAGRIAPEALPAAKSLAAGIERLERRYKRVYVHLSDDGPSPVKELDELAKCEKTLLECKLRLYAFLGIGPGDGAGDVRIVVDGFETPQQ